MEEIAIITLVVTSLLSGCVLGSIFTLHFLLKRGWQPPKLQFKDTGWLVVQGISPDEFARKYHGTIEEMLRSGYSPADIQKVVNEKIEADKISELFGKGVES